MMLAATLSENVSEWAGLGFVLAGLVTGAFSILLLVDRRRTRYWAGAVLGAGAALFALQMNVPDEFDAGFFVLSLALLAVAAGGLLALFTPEQA